MDNLIDTLYNVMLLALLGCILLCLLFMVVMIGSLGVSVLAEWRGKPAGRPFTAPATLVAKRSETYQDQGDSGTRYYVAFELGVQDDQWGTLLEGDRGRLTYRGSGFAQSPQDR